jgi:CheY-like chemotaxis protein
LRVLIVDDHATNRRILGEMLASWRMKPVAVADARAAIEALQKASPTSRRYHAVISDCQMPEVDGYTLAKWIKHDDRLRKTPFVMLTSLGRTEDPARLRRLGISAYLTKPVKHSDLFDALASLFAPRREKPRSAPALAARALRSLRILVAEDQAVNRRLVTTILEKRGHKVVQVEDGRQACDAVAASAGRPFDVIIMDLQMPDMGGLEATQQIRQREAGASTRVPIVALTAHAMKGDRDRCLAGGMDEYLSKPIDTPLLIATVEGIAEPSRQPPASGAATASSPDLASHAVFDEVAALRRTGGDRRLLKQLVALYRADAPETLAQIEKAVAARDAEALRVAAHTLKGSVATVGGASARHTALALENLGKTGNLDAAPATLAALRSDLSKLDHAFVAARMVRNSPRAKATRRRTAAKKKPRSRSKRS